MSLIKTSCFHLSTGLNPRTQNKDSLEDSVSTSPEPSKNGQLTVKGAGGRPSGEKRSRTRSRGFGRILCAKTEITKHDTRDGAAGDSVNQVRKSSRDEE